ncbi:lipocalin family protein [Crenobacter sp. SG2305]|nr:lipocalin family protein [Crenobacter sp. SG2305]MDN0084969.1 lipocalin family protein [Crenobacter sp. SG2305]
MYLLLELRQETGYVLHHAQKLLAVLAASLFTAGCSTLPPAGIHPVGNFSLTRYNGNWYEIARLDHSFERGLTDVSAGYSQNSDGSIRVLNRGYDVGSGRWKQAQCRALFNFDPQTASLKVSFFGPFCGGYHVVALDPDYRWALVAGNDRNYLWILARERQLPVEVRNALLQQARSLGFDTNQLIWVSHSRGQP